jgi:hypothetical protein
VESAQDPFYLSEQYSFLSHGAREAWLQDSISVIGHVDMRLVFLVTSVR